MKRLIIFLFQFGLCFGMLAQQPPKKIETILDTVRLKEVTVSSTIPLNNKQIEKFYKTNYFSTIDNLTAHLDGMSLIKRGSYAMEPQLNGFSGARLNITISGMKMFGACTDKMDPVTSYIEPVNLKSITLEHGTDGGLYGNNVGGSVDMALQEPDRTSTHPFYSSLSFGYESVSNGRNVLLSTGYTKNKWAWGLNGVYRKNDIYRDGSGRSVRFSQFEKSNIHSVLIYQADTVSSFKADVLYDLATNVGYPALPMDVSKARAALFALEYRRIKPSGDMQAKIYYNSVYHVMDDSKRDSLFIIHNGGASEGDSVFMRMDMPGRSSTFGAFFQTNLRINSKNKLTIKVDNYSNSSIAEMTMHMHFPGEPPEPPMYLQTWPRNIRNVTGLYIRNATAFSRRLTMNVNGRVDYNIDKLQTGLAAEQFSVFNYNLPEKFSKMTFGMNLSLQYRILHPLLLTFQTGFSERVPDKTELFGFYLFNAYDGYDYIGNPFLKTEKSVSGRVSLTYFKNGLKINLSQSGNFLRDYIMGKTNTLIPPMNFYTNGLRVYENVPSANLASTDLQLMYSPVKGLSVFMLSKYTYGRLKSGEPIPLIPPFKNVLSVCYEIKSWSFQAENETALRQNRINVQYGEVKSPAFSVFNVKSSYRFNLYGAVFDCSLGVTNLLNKNYSEHLDWGHIPRPGRSFNFLIKYTY